MQLRVACKMRLGLECCVMDYCCVGSFTACPPKSKRRRRVELPFYEETIDYIFDSIRAGNTTCKQKHPVTAQQQGNKKMKT